MMAKRILASATLFALLVVSGCATDVGTIDRTQHDKYSKGVFGGVWFMTQTVVDIPYNAAFTFVGEMNFGNTGKVIFDIQEKTLMVYPVVEYVEDSEKQWHSEKIFRYWDDRCLSRDSEEHQCIDGKDNLGQDADPTKLCCFVELYVGQPIAAFEILSHFDVKRKYNAQTGEQTNVLEENTTDKLWWQRGWIRVNWARNLINDFNFMARIVNQTPIDYYVQSFEADNPDAPTVTSDYIDVVTKMHGEPESSGVCDIYGISTGDCVSATVKFRTAFRKVDPANDYEPLRFHNESQQRYFGYFLTERNAYDEDYGLTNAGKVSLINRWNIWRSSMADVPVVTGKDETGNDVLKPCLKDLANTGCDTRNIGGSREVCQADGWFMQGYCVTRTPKPFTQRGLRPVVFHVSPNMPVEMWNGSLRTAHEWSEALKDTVAWLYMWEEKGTIVGQTQSRECTIDADCAPHAVLDASVEIDEPPVPRDDTGKKLRMESRTVIATGARAGVTLIDFNYPTGLGGNTAIRFVNASPDRTVSFGIEGGNTLFTDVGPVAAGPNPLDLAYVMVPAPAGPSFVVTQNGTEVARLDGTWTLGGTTALIVFDGDSLSISSAKSLDIRGIRVVNASPIAVDVSIDAGLRFANLQPGQDTGYLTVGGGSSGSDLPIDYVPARVVAVPTGERGDVTCLRTEQFSKCVGGSGDVDWDRLAAIKAQLPELFVMCRNQYDPAQYNPWKSPFYAPWNEVKDQDPKALTDRIMNPCVDFLFRADRLTEEEKLLQAKTMKKVGDSRYSGIYWVPEAQLAGPLGYGPSAADPETGEIFWGVANIYGAALYNYAAMTRDLFDLINGNVGTEEYVTGSRIREYILDGMGTGTESVTSALSDQGMSIPDDINVKGAAAANRVEMFNNPMAGRRYIQKDVWEAMKDKEIGQLMVNNLPTVNPNFGKTRLAAFKGTVLEDLLVNQEMAMAAASPLNWANLGDLLAKDKERRLFLSRNNYCFADFDDSAILGMARSWGCVPGDARPACGDDFYALDHSGDLGSTCCIKDGNQLANVIAQRFYTAVVEHEVGHTVGLRHNFEGSADLFNYPDRYFDIREKDVNPCLSDGECDQIFGEFCKDDVCQVAQSKTCAEKDDCIYGKNASGNTIKAAPMSTDAYDCVAGQCVELTRCGLHGECGAGQICDNASWSCYKDGVRVERPVGNGGPVRKFLPRAELTTREAELSRTQYQYSSIMDYGQRWNSDIMDLGKYDKAAIRFGYGQLMDVYQNLGRLWQNLHTFAEAYGIDDTQNSDMLDSSYWGWGVHFSQFYFLQDNIGVDENRSEGEFSHNRAAVPFEWVVNQQSVSMNYYRQYIDWAYVIVPYKFCGDEYEGNVGCYTWDTGVDVLEMVYNMGVAMKDYYLVDAFKRDRYGFGLGGDPMSYLTRVLTRYMDRMRGAGMYYALFANIFKNYDWRGSWADTRLMGWALRRASETGFELLANAITSPAPGSYVLDDATNTYQNVDYSSGVQGSELDVPLGTGKYPYTTFMDDAGYFYWNNALWIGSFWEKLAAIMTLTDSTVYFTTDFVGEQLNIGVGTSIGFNTLYQRQLTELFGGMVTGDGDRRSWVAEEGRATPRRYFDPENPNGLTTENALLTPIAYDASVPLVAPSIENLTMKLYLMLYGMAYIPASFDPSFLDSFTICIKGNGNCYDIGESADTAAREFTDPFAGKTYVVWAPSYQANWYSPNVALVDRANTIKVEWESCSGEAKLKAETELRKVIEVLDLMRTVYEVMSSMRI